MSVYVCGAMTDCGDVREENQDSILCIPEEGRRADSILCLVADGMGGLSWGSQVSRFIADSFACWWETEFKPMLRFGYTRDEDIRELLEQEIWDINKEIADFRKKAGCRCGSTLSLLLMYNGRYYIENMGDSRVYRLRGNHMEQLTRDQSLAAQLEREGKLTPEEAAVFDRKNVLTMCLGMFDIPQSYFTCGGILENDCFLLCSDGLYNPLDEQKIKEILSRKELSCKERAILLRSKILPGEGRDNISAIVAEAERIL